MVHDIRKTIEAGLAVLSSDDTKVPASQLEYVGNLKGLLIAVLEGKLVLADPDRIKKDEEPNKGNPDSEIISDGN